MMLWRKFTESRHHWKSNVIKTNKSVSLQCPKYLVVAVSLQAFCWMEEWVSIVFLLIFFLTFDDLHSAALLCGFWVKLYRLMGLLVLQHYDASNVIDLLHWVIISAHTVTSALVLISKEKMSLLLVGFETRH